MNFDNFNRIVEMVIKKSPFQKKKLRQYLDGKDITFFEEAELFAVKYGGYLDSQGIPLDYAVSSYLEMCENMMICQIEFMKTGKYTVNEHIDAFDAVYSSEEKMKSYMIGLAISQFLWPTHYEMYRFFAQAITKHSLGISSYLEIGPGHGLYLNKAMDYLPNGAIISAVDISPISIAITKSIMVYFKHDFSAIDFRTQDVLQFDSNNKFDFITMGEVLEHVNFPEKLLCKLHSLLAESGRVFVSTCVNAPAIDHVYHFRRVGEITNMLNECGFHIEEERILPVENLPMDVIINKKIAINYCAILKKNEQF
jgi:SAM-dependent methyltransferase